LKLRIYGDPALRQESTPVAEVDDRLRQLAKDMIETMHAEAGIGLASQQVGETVSLCVVDVTPKADTDDEGRRMNPDAEMPMVLFNPRIVSASDETSAMEEGCLSFPDIRAPVTRPEEVTVQWMDAAGAERELRVRGLVGRCIQHEMDHLRGVLICDRMSAVKKISLAGKLRRLKHETEAHLGLDGAGGRRRPAIR